jgi:CheY-like chemotaxis protein
MLVDDEVFNLKAMSHILTKIDPEMRLFWAEDGKIAVELYKEKNRSNSCKNCDFFLMIVMDINMITMDGHEATRQIVALKEDLFLKNNSINTVKILGCTAYTCVNAREQGLASGMQGFMHKPILRKNCVQSLIELGILGQEAMDAHLPVPERGPPVGG